MRSRAETAAVVAAARAGDESMNWARWERFAPLTGIVAVVLWILGVIIEASTDYSEPDTPEEILAVLQEDANTLIAAGIVFAFGVVFFIWFLGSLRAALYGAEGGVGRLSSIAYGSGMLAAICLLQVAPTVQGAVDEDDLSADAAQSLQSMGEAFTELTLIAMFLAVGLLILRTRVLAAWLGWVSLAVALLLAIVPICWAGVVWAFPLWVLVTSVLLYLRAPACPISTTSKPRTWTSSSTAKASRWCPPVSGPRASAPGRGSRVTSEHAAVREEERSLDVRRLVQHPRTALQGTYLRERLVFGQETDKTWFAFYRKYDTLASSLPARVTRTLEVAAPQQADVRLVRACASLAKGACCEES